MSDPSRSIDSNPSKNTGIDINVLKESSINPETARIDDGDVDYFYAEPVYVTEGQSSSKTLSEDIGDESSVEPILEESSDSEFNPSEGEFDDDQSVDSEEDRQTIGEIQPQPLLSIKKSDSQPPEKGNPDRMDVEGDDQKVEGEKFADATNKEDPVHSTGVSQIDESDQRASNIGRWAKRNQKTRMICRHFSCDLLKRAVQSQWEPELLCDLLYMISKELNFDYAMMRNFIRKNRIGTPRLLVSLIDRDFDFFFTCHEICSLILSAATDMTPFLQLLDEALSLELINLEEENAITTVCQFLLQSLNNEDLIAYATVLCEYCPSTEYCGKVLEQITSKLELQPAAELIADVITLDFFAEIKGTMKECLGQLSRTREEVEVMLDEGYERRSESGDIIESDEDSEGNLREFVISDEALQEELEAVAKEVEESEPLLSPLPSDDDEDKDQSDEMLEEGSNDSSSFKNDEDSEGFDDDQGGNIEKRVFLRFRAKETRKQSNENEADPHSDDENVKKGSDNEEEEEEDGEEEEEVQRKHRSGKGRETTLESSDIPPQLSKIERKRVQNQRRRERRKQRRAEQMKDEIVNENSLLNQKRQRDTVSDHFNHQRGEGGRAEKRQRLNNDQPSKGEEFDHYLDGLESSMVVRYEGEGERQAVKEEAYEGINVKTEKTEEDNTMRIIDEKRELSIFEL